MEINIFTTSGEAWEYKYNNNSINITAIFYFSEFLSSGMIWKMCFVLFGVNNRFHKKNNYIGLDFFSSENNGD